MKRSLLIRFDGGCRNNGTPRAQGVFGWQILEGEWILAEANGNCTGSPQTNNTAEFDGLIDALSWLRCYSQRPEDITIEGDSQLVVKLVTGKAKTDKPHLECRVKEVWRLLRAMNGYRWPVRWIPREQNAAADEFASRAYSK